MQSATKKMERAAKGPEYHWSYDDIVHSTTWPSVNFPAPRTKVPHSSYIACSIFECTENSQSRRRLCFSETGKGLQSVYEKGKNSKKEEFHINAVVRCV